MIRLLAIVIALVIALMGGAAGLIHFGFLPDFTGLIPKVDQPQGEGAEEGEEVQRPQQIVSPAYQFLPPFLIPMVRDGQLERSFYLSIRLQVPMEQANTAQMYHPRLRDAYMRALFELIPESLEGRQTLDLVRIKRRLMEITPRVTGEGVVEDILFQAVFER